MQMNIKVSAVFKFSNLKVSASFRHVQITQNRMLVMFLQNLQKKLSQLLLCSIVIQNIQIFYGGPVVFVVTSFSHVVRHLSKLEIDHVILVGCCTYVWACPKFFEITSCQYLWKQMSSCLVFLYMAKHRWKLPIDYVIFVGCGPVRACPKFSEITNYKNLEKEFRDYFLHAGRHTWKPQSNHAILVGWFQACPSLPKVLRTANCQYFWKGWVIISVLCK